MAVIGSVDSKANKEVLRGYENNPFRPLAEQFRDVAQAGLSEDVDIFTEPSTFLRSKVLSDQMKNFFMQESFDPADPEFKGHPEAVNEHNKMMEQLYNNDSQLICESAPLGSLNAVVGITFPIHKNLLQTTVFDKGAIPKDVAAGPKFTLSMETRKLVAPDGQEIDMFLEQNKIKDVIESSVPRKDIIIKLPEDRQTDVLALLGAVNKTTANLSVSTKVTKIIVKGVYCVEGDEYLDDAGNVKVVAQGEEGVKNKIIPVEPISFAASYGQLSNTFQRRIDLIVPDSATSTKQLIFTIAGSMQKNRFTFMSTSTDIVAVVLSAALDVSSAAYSTPKVKWSVRTDYFEIPDAPHVTVTLAPEEVKDIQAMYNVNQLTKIMSMIKLSLVNYKDGKILEDLDESFLNLPAQNKVTGAFNFCPPDGYMGDFVTWRYSTFMDYLDSQVTTMLQVLNDENVTVSIFGRPELIRKITPKEYTYTTPPSIGPVMLDYKKTIKTTDNRIYQFISSNKLRNDNNLIIILCPRNSNRVMYKIFDYQLYVGNEIRDTDNYQLPAVTAFERFLFVQYQPVQGRVQIVNPSGLKEQIENENPIGDRALNDYTANKVTYKDGKFVQFSEEDIPGTARSAILPDTNGANESKGEITSGNSYVYAPNYSIDDPSDK